MPNILAWAGSMAVENIANSDALYHDVEHTILVTLVGQEVLRGQPHPGGREFLLKTGCTSSFPWLATTLAMCAVCAETIAAISVPRALTAR